MGGEAGSNPEVGPESKPEERPQENRRDAIEREVGRTAVEGSRRD